MLPAVCSRHGRKGLINAGAPNLVRCFVCLRLFVPCDDCGGNGLDEPETGSCSGCEGSGWRTLPPRVSGLTTIR